MNNENERNNNDIIRNFLRNGRQEGLLESLLLVGTNMIINDISGNNIPSTNIQNTNYRNWYYNSTRNFDNSNYLLNDVINRSFHEKPSYKNVISQKGLLELEERKFNELDKNHSCPIYQINFTNESDIIKLPCNHVFTPEAIKKWLKEENAICPVCRYKLDSIMIKTENMQPENMQPENMQPENMQPENMQIFDIPDFNLSTSQLDDEDIEESQEVQIFPEIYYQNYENENENENENNNENENENEYEYANEYEYLNNNENENENDEEIEEIVPNPSTFFDYVMDLFNREEERIQLEEQAIQQTILNSLEDNN